MVLATGKPLVVIFEFVLGLVGIASIFAPVKARWVGIAAWLGAGGLLLYAILPARTTLATILIVVVFALEVGLVVMTVRSGMGMPTWTFRWLRYIVKHRRLPPKDRLRRPNIYKLAWRRIQRRRLKRLRGEQ
jgi:hypothetical protein